MKGPEYHGQRWDVRLAQQALDRTNTRIHRQTPDRPKIRHGTPDTGKNMIDFRSVLQLYPSLAHGFILLAVGTMILTSAGCTPAPNPDMTPNIPRITLPLRIDTRLEKVSVDGDVLLSAIARLNSDPKLSPTDKILQIGTSWLK